MCSLKKILFKFHNFPDIINNRYNSDLNYIEFCNYVRMLNHYCKCEKNKFDIKHYIKVKPLIQHYDNN